MGVARATFGGLAAYYGDWAPIARWATRAPQRLHNGVPCFSWARRTGCSGAPSSGRMPPPGGRGVPGDCPARSHWPGRASQRANVRQTMVDSAGLPLHNATRRGRFLFVYCTHSPELCATLYLPILYAIWTGRSRMRAAVPEQYRISAPAGPRAGCGAGTRTACVAQGVPRFQNARWMFRGVPRA